MSLNSEHICVTDPVYDECSCQSANESCCCTLSARTLTAMRFQTYEHVLLLLFSPSRVSMPNWISGVSFNDCLKPRVYFIVSTCVKFIRRIDLRGTTKQDHA